ncbi:MAG TPA: divalent-cation tolerance protein CutA [Saprospiraceae bacterium]|nr:divalent-cation tolerance protein CutA [Saprospiraceae bacterium]
MSFLMFYVTHPDEACARRIAGQLLDKKLIACANIFPVASAYWWQESVQHDHEWVSVLKTTPELEQSLEQAVAAMHPYDLPCILRFEVRANVAYEQWIRDSTKRVQADS